MFEEERAVGCEARCTGEVLAERDGAVVLEIGASATLAAQPAIGCPSVRLKRAAAEILLLPFDRSRGINSEGRLSYGEFFGIAFRDKVPERGKLGNDSTLLLSIRQLRKVLGAVNP